MTNHDNLPKINFAKNYPILLALIIPMTVIVLFFFGAVTVPIIISLSSGLNLSFRELLSLIIINVIVFGLGIFAWVVGYTETSIEFSELHIRKKGIIRPITIKWSEVVSVYMIGSRITIRSLNNDLRLNTIYFQEPNKIIKFIQDHVDQWA